LVEFPARDVIKWDRVRKKASVDQLEYLHRKLYLRGTENRPFMLSQNYAPFSSDTKRRPLNGSVVY
jgi:hypothetical protein